jgi:hypothetical protein
MSKENTSEIKKLSFPKLTIRELEQMEIEIEPFRVQAGSDEQKLYMENHNHDITGLLLTKGEDKWLAMKGIVKLDPTGRFGPAVVCDKDGNNQYALYCNKLQQYNWYHDMKLKGRFNRKKFEEVEALPDPIKDIDPNDIPF